MHILCLYIPELQKQVYNYVKSLSEQSKRKKEQTKNKTSVLVAESAYNFQKTTNNKLLTLFVKKMHNNISKKNLIDCVFEKKN